MSETDDDSAAIRRAAMDLLARREHSRRELLQKLCKRFDDPDLVAEQLDRLVAENLQSDTRYVDSMLRQRLNRGYGPARIRQEMRQKGVADADIRSAMAELEPDWFHLAEQVWQRKFGAEPAADIREKARRDRFMRYRGFAGEHYQHLLER
jgi:regulatory protein